MKINNLDVKDAWVKINDTMDILQEVIEGFDDSMSIEEADMCHNLDKVWDKLEKTVTVLEEYFDMDKD